MRGQAVSFGKRQSPACQTHQWPASFNWGNQWYFHLLSPWPSADTEDSVELSLWCWVSGWTCRGE